MADKQKNSVDYYIDGLAEILDGTLDSQAWLRISSKAPELKELYEEVMALHKEEIINAYQAGDGDAYNLDETRDFGEQYYNEKFGGAL